MCRGALLFCILLLVSCGGGSGDGDGRSSNSSISSAGSITPPIVPVVEYEGNKNYLRINKESSLYISDLLQEVPGLFEFSSSFYEDLSGTAIRGNINESLEGGKILVKGNIANERAFLTYEFFNFINDGQSLSGSVSMVYGASPDFKLQATYFDRLVLSSANESASIHGSILWNSFYFPKRSCIFNISITESGVSTYFNNLQYEEENMGSVFNNEYSMAINGLVFNSMLGIIEVNTSTPLKNIRRDQSLELSADTGGKIEFLGDHSRALVTSLSYLWMGFALDEDGDNVFELGKRMPWRVEAVRNIAADEKLQANAGGLTTGYLGNSLYLNGLFSHLNNDFLTYQWKLIAKPQESIVEMQDLTSPFQEFTPDVVGSYLFSLEVKSGEKSGKTTFILDVREPIGEVPDVVTRGAIELLAQENRSVFDLQSFAFDNTSYVQIKGPEARSGYDTKLITIPNTFHYELNTNERGLFSISAENQIGKTSTLYGMEIPFYLPMHYSSGARRGAESLTEGDIDGDGVKDVMFLNQEINNNVYSKLKFSYISGSSKNIFDFLDPDIESYNLGKTFLADMDGDKKDDLISVISGEGSSKYFKIHTDLVSDDYKNFRSYNFEFNMSVIGAGNITDSSRKQILFVNNFDRQLYVLSLKDGAIDIKLFNIEYIEGYNNYHLDTKLIDLIDIDRDGLDEVVIDSFVSRNIDIYKNYGDGQYKIAVSIPVDRSSVDVSTAFVASAFLIEGKRSIFFNNSNTLYAIHVSKDFSYEQQQIFHHPWSFLFIDRHFHFEDVNGDGYADITVASHYQTLVSLSLNDNNRIYWQEPLFLQKASSSDVGFIDVNDDGALDLVQGGELGFLLKIGINGTPY